MRVSVKESAGLAEIPRGDTTLTFTAPGDRLTYFPVEVGEGTGVARFSVTASGNGQQSNQDIELNVREPNAPTRRSSTVALPPGESRTIPYTPVGLSGTRSASLELSGLPAMNLQRHLEYLITYPYGCVEQVVSAAFAQLYLDRVMPLRPEQEALRRRHVTAGIEALRRFLTASGGMSYWPGGQQVQPWATNFALHFILEAERAGFGVPYDLRRDLIAFQQAAASSWSRTDGAFYATLRQRTLDQAYRLYTLALARQSDFGAMNRLRGAAADLSPAATYQLAAAYALAGRQTTAAELTAATPATVSPYRELDYTFGSDLRDMAIILESQLTLKQETEAAEQAARLARTIGDRHWLTTQEAGLCVCRPRQARGGRQKHPFRPTLHRPAVRPPRSVSPPGSTPSIFPRMPTRQLRSRTRDRKTLFVTTLITGTPTAGLEEVTSNQLELRVSYTDLNGRPLNVASLESGTDFLATYRLTNPGTTGQDYHQLALSRPASLGLGSCQ